MSLIKHLQEMGRLVEDSVYDLNRGGCGLYAAIVALRLQRLGIQTVCKVECPWGSEEDVGQLYRTLRPKNVRELPIKFWHVYVQFSYDGKAWGHDSRATRPWSHFERDSNFHPGSLAPEEMLRLARPRTGWNKDFNRAQYGRVVRRTVANYFNKLPALLQSMPPCAPILPSSHAADATSQLELEFDKFVTYIREKEKCAV
jgi:hypothetical protein